MSVCLFVRSITQKRMIPKCSNLVQGMNLEYSTSDIILLSYVVVLGSKSQRSRLGLWSTAIRCGFELYECLLVLYAANQSIIGVWQPGDSIKQ